jgi:hypothetical protein
MSLGDVAVMIAVIVLVPYLYVRLPTWLITGLFASGILSIFTAVFKPVMHRRWAVWLAAVGLLGGDVAAWFLSASSPTYVLINDVVLTLAVAGTTNLWAQSGMKARDVTVLAIFLAGYDLVATSLLPLTTDMLHHLARMPLSPELSWGVGSQQVALGLGDLLLLTIFPLTLGKAFGPRAATAAMVIETAAIALMMEALTVASVRVSLPVMTALGPLMALQYVYWRNQQGEERTLMEYRRVAVGNE